MRRYADRLGALLLCLVLCLGLFPAAGAAENTISIGSAQELIAFSKRCTSDTWSQGVTVVLTADLSLAGTGFSPIPVFCGTFDAAGHKITGFTFLGKGSDIGLFRYLRAGSVVRDLTLDGVVAPGGSQCGVGVLAGQNEGTIERCTVTGDATGDARIGGIAGYNGASGIIRGCENRAAITGNTGTGGIAGENDGLIDACTNYGAVNTKDNDAATDTGGIAGRSSGTLQGCVNWGEVGYNHTGYNVGGIAGLQDGGVAGCENHGAVFGRKDVGGIVGQFEPDTVLTYGEDPIEKLDSELAALSGLLNRLSNQASGVTGDAVDDISVISGALSGLRDTAAAAGSEARNDARDASDQIYASAQAVNTALDALLDDLDAFSGDANRDLNEVNRQLSALRKALSDAGAALDTFLYNSRGSLEWDMNAIQGEADGIAGEITLIAGEIERLEGFLKDALQAAAQMDPEAVRDAYERWNIGGIDVGGHVSAISTRLKNMAVHLKNLAGDLAYNADTATDAVNDAMGHADEAAKALVDAFDALNAHAKTFSDAATGGLRTVNTELDAIEDCLKGYLDTLGDKSALRTDEINGQLTAISDRVDQMTQGAAQANSDLHGTTSAIIGQLDRVRAAVVALTEEPEKTVEDASGEGDGDSGPGLVVSCLNTGAIQGDANVGGIAGIVSPELSLDPELDLDLSDSKLLVDTTATLRATIRACDNRGDITAKTGCAGGILGRAEVGAVLDSTSACAVAATGGSQCGGIAGLSRGRILRCAAQCDLSGEGSLGGIAGEGRDIADCRAMTRVEGAGERLGAIAGWADGTLSGNFFLEEEVAGVDGINYAGQADPLPFEDFSALAGVPAGFLSFSITFRAGDTEVATLEVPYGGALSPGDFPAVPSDDGRYGQWEDFPCGRITRSRTVEAVYSDWVSTISSGGRRPLVLAEGAFSPAARLTLTQRDDLIGTAAEGRTVAAAYDFAIADDEALPETVTLRVLAEGAGDRASLALLADGALRPIDAASDGSYLVCTAGAQGTLVVLTGAPTPLPVGLLGGIGAGAALLLLLLWRRRKPRPPKTAREPAAAGADHP